MSSAPIPTFTIRTSPHPSQRLPPLPDTSLRDAVEKVVAGNEARSYPKIPPGTVCPPFLQDLFEQYDNLFKLFLAHSPIPNLIHHAFDKHMRSRTLEIESKLKKPLHVNLEQIAKREIFKDSPVDRKTFPGLTEGRNLVKQWYYYPIAIKDVKGDLSGIPSTRGRSLSSRSLFTRSTSPRPHLTERKGRTLSSRFFGSSSSSPPHSPRDTGSSSIESNFKQLCNADDREIIYSQFLDYKRSQKGVLSSTAIPVFTIMAKNIAPKVENTPRGIKAIDLGELYVLLHRMFAVLDLFKNTEGTMIKVKNRIESGEYEIELLGSEPRKPESTPTFDNIRSGIQDIRVTWRDSPKSVTQIDESSLEPEEFDEAQTREGFVIAIESCLKMSIDSLTSVSDLLNKLIPSTHQYVARRYERRINEALQLNELLRELLRFPSEMSDLCKSTNISFHDKGIDIPPGTPERQINEMIAGIDVQLPFLTQLIQIEEIVGKIIGVLKENSEYS